LQGRPLSELNSLMIDMPQVLINARVRRRESFDNIRGYRDVEAKILADLKDEGRLFVRFSGTEPKVRVLVEGPDRVKITAFAEEVAALLERELN